MRTPWVYFDGKCSGCKYLNDRGYCEFTACIIPCTVRATIPEVKPKSNADRIRSMSDAELAEWIVRKTEGYGFDGYNESVKAWLKWLREECNE